MAEIIRNADWQCVSISNPLEATALINEYQPDVLLIDQFMPEENGLDVVAELREQGNRLPVILFSGDPDAIDRGEMDRLGVAKLLAKPISVKELQGALKTLCAVSKPSTMES